MGQPNKYKHPAIVESVLQDYAISGFSKTQICKNHNISYNTLAKLIDFNEEEYFRICEKLKKQVSAKALTTAKRALDKISDKKLEKSTGIQLSSIAKNVAELYLDKPNITINVDIPESKEDLLKFVFEKTKNDDCEKLSTNENNSKINEIVEIDK